MSERGSVLPDGSRARPRSLMSSSDRIANMASRPNKKRGQGVNPAAPATGVIGSGDIRHRTRATGTPPVRRSLDAATSAENGLRRALGVRPAQIRQEPSRTDRASHGGVGGSAGLRVPGTYQRGLQGTATTFAFRPRSLLAGEWSYRPQIVFPPNGLLRTPPVPLAAAARRAASERFGLVVPRASSPMQLRRPRHTGLDQAVPTDRLPKTVRERRRCAGCRAWLSQYNPNDYCWPCKPEGRRIIGNNSREERARMEDLAELMESV